MTRLTVSSPAPNSRVAPGESLADRYPDRYGHRGPRQGRRAAIAGGGVVALAMLSWAGWVGVRQARTPATWQVGSFQAVDDGHARLAFDVTTEPGRTVVCTVRMFNAGLTEVGRMDVTVGPSTQRTFQAVVTVPTFEPAVSGRIRACATR